VEPFFNRAAQTPKGRGGAFGRFTIARIGYAFAAAGRVAVGDFRYDNRRLGLGPAADDEAARNWPAFDANRKTRHFPCSRSRQEGGVCKYGGPQSASQVSCQRPVKRMSWKFGCG